MNLVLVSDDFKETAELTSIDKLANSWYYNPDDEVAVFLGLLLFVGNNAYFLKRYGDTPTFEEFVKNVGVANHCTNLFSNIKSSNNIDELSQKCKESLLELEVEDWDVEESPLFQMDYADSPLYCLEPSADPNWVNAELNNIKLPTYEE